MLYREFSAGGVVLKKQGDSFKILLIKDSYGRWTWPKGKIDKGESAKEAALREINEETGLGAIDIIKQIGKTRYFYTFDGRRIFKTVHIFLCVLSGPQKLRVQTEEIRAAKWFDAREALRRVDYRGSKSIIKEAVSYFRAGQRKGVSCQR